MIISGVQKLTLVDYPGKTACIVFLPGCGLRCRYCHNPDFVLPERIKAMTDSFIPKEPFFRFLEARKGKLDGVSICGGEPTMHQDLPEFIKKIKDLGFLVKLDTNGHNHEMVLRLVKAKSVDYFAVDVKQTSKKYATLCGENADPEKVFKTAQTIMDSGIDYEFRTTVSEGEHTEADIEEIAKSIRGARRYFLQNFRHPGSILDASFTGRSLTKEKLERFAEIARKYVKEVKIRE